MNDVKIMSMLQPKRSSAKQGTAQWTLGNGAVQAKRNSELLEMVRPKGSRVSVVSSCELGETCCCERENFGRTLEPERRRWA